MGNQDQQLVQDIFSKERWMVPLERFIQVLRINIFVVNNIGHPIIHPCGTSRGEVYGCRILTRFLGLDKIEEGDGFFDKFSAYGDYLEHQSKMSLHAFAIPLKVYGRIVAYMIVGPVIMGKRLEDKEYLDLAEGAGLLQKGLLDEIRGLKAVSHVAMNAVLDLLAAITKDFIEIGLENRRLRKTRIQKFSVPKTVAKAAEGLYKQIHFDELLVSVLDVALRLTGAEVGSIMIFDKDSKEMMIRVSRGLTDDWVRKARARMGEGVAGIAAKENRCFIMHGKKGGEEVQPFLNRPDIKESIVMPISHHNRVFGVLNLHSKKENSRIEDNSGYLVSLSKLLSTAVFTQ